MSTPPSLIEVFHCFSPLPRSWCRHRLAWLKFFMVFVTLPGVNADGVPSLGCKSVAPNRFEFFHQLSCHLILHTPSAGRNFFGGGGVSGGGSPYSGVPLNLQMSETHILIRLLRMYFPRNREFGSAFKKLRNFGWRFEPPPLLVRRYVKQTTPKCMLLRTVCTCPQDCTLLQLYLNHLAPEFCFKF
jgi:hypothetical protein